MRIRTAIAEAEDACAAREELAARLGLAGSAPPDFVAVHHAAPLGAEAVCAALGPALGARALHGGTSCLGAMSESGVAIASGRGIGAFAIWDPAGDYASAARPLGETPRAAAREAARAALAAAGRDGESPDLVWLTAVPGAEEEILAGIAEVAGADTPVLGGSAADNAVEGGWAVFDALASHPAGVVVSVLFPSRPVFHAFQNGYAPSGRSGRVTAARGRRLAEIDGRAAGEVYAGWAGGAVARAVARAREEGRPAPILSESTFAPLGRPAGAFASVPFHVLAHPATAEPDGALGLFADVAEGERVDFMTGSPDSLVARAGRVARLAVESGGLEGERIAGALVVYCGGCMLAVRERMDEVVEGLRGALGPVPFLGVFSFGEQGPDLHGENLHGNLMISCVVFQA
jgi:hypothetical protein